MNNCPLLQLSKTVSVHLVWQASYQTLSLCAPSASWRSLLSFTKTELQSGVLPREFLLSVRVWTEHYCPSEILWRPTFLTKHCPLRNKCTYFCRMIVYTKNLLFSDKIRNKGNILENDLQPCFCNVGNLSIQVLCCEPKYPVRPHVSGKWGSVRQWVRVSITLVLWRFQRVEPLLSSSSLSGILVISWLSDGIFWKMNS